MSLDSAIARRDALNCSATPTPLLFSFFPSPLLPLYSGIGGHSLVDARSSVEQTVTTYVSKFFGYKLLETTNNICCGFFVTKKEL